jgi:choice-of-anchor A domain-containing protein
MSGDLKYAIIAGGSINYHDHGEIINGGVAYENEISLPNYIKEAIERFKCPIDKISIIDFDEVKDNLTSLSKKINKLEGNAKTTDEYGKLVIDLVPGQKQYVIKADNISQYWDVEIKENGVDADDITIIFNLGGSDITLKDFNVSSLNKYASHIVWNASNAKRIHIENFRIQGSLLAPNADIEGTNANIQGILIGNNFKGNLQVDWVPFYGCIDTGESKSFFEKILGF